MTTHGRNLVGGSVIAAVIAILFSNATIAGVSTWKWALGLIGLILWLLAERTPTPRP
jgi:hypothetical protein